MKAGRILLFACLFLWTGVSAWAIANPENHCSRVAAGAISNARYYDPELGRFIQPDTVIQDLSNPQSYNRYSYCVNNPLRYTDPTGKDYIGDVGGMFVGYYQAAAGLVTGTAFMVAHPITTAQGIGTAVAHPINTGSAIASGIAKDWNSGAEGQGRVVGGALLAVGSVLAPGAEAGNLSKVGEVANAGEKVEQAAATAGKELRRPYIRNDVRAEVEARAPKTADGKFIDPNTGEVIEGKYDLGHKPGNEFRTEQAKAQSEGLTQKQFNDRMNNPDKYQIESPSANRSHAFEKKDNP